jgi:hypothetical protein
MYGDLKSVMEEVAVANFKVSIWYDFKVRISCATERFDSGTSG